MFSQKVVIFGVGNSSLEYPENRKNNFLVLSERQTDDINDRVSFIKSVTELCLNLHYSDDLKLKYLTVIF